MLYFAGFTSVPAVILLFPSFSCTCTGRISIISVFLYWASREIGHAIYSESFPLLVESRECRKDLCLLESVKVAILSRGGVDCYLWVKSTAKSPILCRGVWVDGLCYLDYF